MRPPPLVLLPGMMLDARVFAAQVTSLSQVTEVSVVEITAGESVEQIANDVLDRAPRHFALGGLSMGGIVALEMWRQAPDRITHLALIGTTPHADRAERFEQRRQQMADVERGGLRDVLVNSLMPQYLAAKNRQNVDIQGSILDMGLALGPKIFRCQSIALSNRPDSVATLSTIDCPALVLCGREDALCSAAVHQMMAGVIARADLSILAQCGHLSPLEQPQAVNLALQHLLDRVS